MTKQKDEPEVKCLATSQHASPDRYNITKELVIDMLYEDRGLAYKEGKASAALAVTKLFGDSIGMFKQNVDSNNTTVNFVRPFTENDKRMLEAMGLNFADMKIDPRGYDPGK